MLQVAVLHELLQALLLEQAVDVRHPLRQRVIENDAANRGVDDPAVERFHGRVQHVLVVTTDGEVHKLAAQTKPDGSERLHNPRIERKQRVVLGTEHATLALGMRLRLREIVAPSTMS